MGRHADEQRRRGIAAWPIVTGLAVVVIGGLLIAYFTFLSNDAASTDTSCSTTNTVEVVAGPEAAPIVTAAAATFNTTGAQARGACLTVNVTEMDSKAASSALAGGWGQSSPPPSVWVPDSAVGIADLTAAQPTMTAGMTSDPLATSPVVLATTGATAAALSAPPVWSDLSASGVRLGLADPQSDLASFFALQSVLAKTATDPKPLTKADVAAGAAQLGQLSTSSVATSGSDSALTALAGTANFTAVPVTEKDLAVFNTANGDALKAVYPVGPAVGYSISAVGLAAPWVDATAQDGASAFISYLGKDETKTLFKNAGFRVAGLAAAAAAHGVDPATAVVVFPGAGNALATELAGAIGQLPAGTAQPSAAESGALETTSAETAAPSTSAAETTAAAAETTPPVEASVTPDPTTVAPVVAEPAPPTGPVITFVVDASAGMSVSENGQSLTSWSQAALNSAIANHPTNSFGLFTVTNAGGAPGYTQLVPTGALADQVGAGTRADALASAISGLSAAGSRWTYAAIINAYREAANTAVPGRVNRVIMIIDGVDMTPNTPRSAVLQTINAAKADGKSVVLDIIGLGSDPPAAALTEITAASGGTYTSIPTANGLPAVIEPLLAG